MINTEPDKLMQTRLKFIGGVVERACKQKSKITFYVGGQSVDIEQDQTTYNLHVTEATGKRHIKFRVAMPGSEAYKYCARRIIETFANDFAHKFYPSQPTATHIYSDDSQEDLMDGEPDNS